MYKVRNVNRIFKVQNTINILQYIQHYGSYLHRKKNCLNKISVYVNILLINTTLNYAFLFLRLVRLCCKQLNILMLQRMYFSENTRGWHLVYEDGVYSSY